MFLWWDDEKLGKMFWGRLKIGIFYRLLYGIMYKNKTIKRQKGIGNGVLFVPFQIQKLDKKIRLLRENTIQL